MDNLTDDLLALGLFLLIGLLIGPWLSLLMVEWVKLELAGKASDALEPLRRFLGIVR